MQAFVKLLTIYDFDIKIANVVVGGGGGKVISRCNLFLSNKNLHCSKWGDCGNGTIIGAPINTIVSNLVEKREKFIQKSPDESTSKQKF